MADGDVVLADRADLHNAGSRDASGAGAPTRRAVAGMRVAHVVRQFYPSTGGLENVVLNLARIQRAEHNIDARIITLDRLFSDPRRRRLAPADTVQGVPVRRMGWTGSSRYPFAPAVLGHIRDVDLVHVHGIDFFFDYLALTRPLHRKPLVATTHGGFFHTSFMRPLKDVYFHVATRGSLRAYDAVIACSEQDAQLFGTIGGQKVVTIENGAEIGKFAGAASPQPQRCLIYFGRLARHKRIEALFQLLAVLRRRSAEWHLIVAGTPFDQTWDDLSTAAARARVRDALEFLPEPDDQQLRQALGRASYYACASAHEGFGIAAVEALSAGLVPVLSDIPPFRKLLNRAVKGILLKVADPDGTAHDIESFHAEFLKTRNDVYAILMSAVAQYDWSTVVKRYVSLYARETAITMNGA
jgi:alpha-1,3-mannosyltransferase